MTGPFPPIISPLGSHPNVTFVTICYRNPADLRVTLTSLAGLPEEYERIVVDGSPDDSCASVTAEFAGIRNIHGPDKGKYDAMNKGLAVARGKTICFMNSGDCLVDAAAFDAMIRSNQGSLDTVIVYGDCIKTIAGEAIVVPAPELTDEALRVGILPSHQSILIPTAYHQRHPYDATMHFAADTKFLKAAFTALPRRHVAVPIALFAQGGASSSPGNWTSLLSQFRELREAHELGTVEQVRMAALLIRRKLFHMMFNEAALQRQQLKRLRRTLKQT
ncbi:putative colanic acid biosynthesis glycosyltransferase [Sphingomonas sp. PP-CE-1A-559]|uniref:glycosyltransferase n=1 Tax=Sphingomonas sp. PP-CE-1A-559 TaxID=2135657 RepID=UPI0010549EF6|nr:glycosyltransferase [Sphingomonas sp. PP-CE-1A-559]TCP87582.1 putative colanic acid biosynthesis glycosyltransferase [Sphingomonas sp. PP-CE-1A-559]